MRITAETIKKAIRDPKTEVVSFDVFDTLLLRPFWQPDDLFFFLDREAERLLCAPDAFCFSVFRKEAEAAARSSAKNRGREDILLPEIYEYLVNEGILPRQAADRLMEKELELRFCTARKSARALMEYALSQGKRVIAISDMYFPASFIEKLLIHNRFPSPERIFVSGECGLSKGTGRLYQHAIAELSVPAGRIIHIGDNPAADIAPAKKAGIRAFYYPKTTALLAGEKSRRYGRAFKRAFMQNNSPFYVRHAMALTGVRCMLAVAANLVYDDPFRDNRAHGDYAGDPELFGCLALGPYALAHALWLYRIAQEEKAGRILLFSRDGRLMYEALRKMQPYADGKVALSYACTSRKAVFPLILRNEEWLLSAGMNIPFDHQSPETLTSLLGAVLKEPEEMPTVITAACSLPRTCPRYPAPA